MKIEISCEYCGCGELGKTDVVTDFYCPVCDDIISINECEIDFIEE